MSKIIRWFLIACFTISACSLAYIYFGDAKAKSTIADNSAELASDKVIQNGEKSEADIKKIKATADYDTVIENLDNKTIKEASKHTASLKKQTMGRIEIPSINLSLPLFEGVSKYKLAVGTGTMKAGQKLNKIGNFAIAGHNMHTNRNILFSQVPTMKNGAKIIVHYGNHHATYRMTSIHTITPTDVVRIQDDEAIEQHVRMITLITCTPDSKNRYMVRGEQVSIDD